MKEKKYRISFPHIGNYYVPIYRLLSVLIDPETTEIILPKMMSKATIDCGSKVSPEFICIPFKYNMGNYIESLENGANVLIQAGGGCRYGYYAEIQEQILKDLGYNFTYISLLEPGGIKINSVYQKFKMLNPKLSFKKFISAFLFAIKMIDILDKVERKIRESMAMVENPKQLERMHQYFLKELGKVNQYTELLALKRKYIQEIEYMPKKKEKLIKIGIVGELYTSMEPFSSLFLEKELAKMGCFVKRYTTVTYLLFQKGKAQKSLLKRAKEYVNFQLGADGLESVSHTLELLEQGYDGIIHIKPFGCTPEINAMPILQKISREKEIPIMYLTFDAQTSEVGVKTRLEAFYDMLQMRKEKIGGKGLLYE